MSRVLSSSMTILFSSTHWLSTLRLSFPDVRHRDGRFRARVSGADQVD